MSPSISSSCGAGHARRDALDVGQHRPGLLDRSIDDELVQELVHRCRSSRVSMSAAEPVHGTSWTRAACSRMSVRAPSSPVVGSSAQTERCSRTGCGPRRPSYEATTIWCSGGAVATARHASGVMNGWSPRRQHDRLGAHLGGRRPRPASARCSDRRATAGCGPRARRRVRRWAHRCRAPVRPLRPPPRPDPHRLSTTWSSA